jgi:hypothetical protein
MTSGVPVAIEYTKAFTLSHARSHRSRAHTARDRSVRDPLGLERGASPGLDDRDDLELPKSTMSPPGSLRHEGIQLFETGGLARCRERSRQVLRSNTQAQRDRGRCSDDGWAQRSGFVKG